MLMSSVTRFVLSIITCGSSDWNYKTNAKQSRLCWTSSFGHNYRTLRRTSHYWQLFTPDGSLVSKMNLTVENSYIYLHKINTTVGLTLHSIPIFVHAILYFKRNFGIGFNGTGTNCGIAHILGILLMNSYDMQIYFLATSLLQLAVFPLWIAIWINKELPYLDWSLKSITAFKTLSN